MESCGVTAPSRGPSYRTTPTHTYIHTHHSALFRWSYGTLHAHVLLPIQTTVTRLTGYVTGQCRRAGTGVVGAAKGAVQFVRDGFEVAGICFGILVLGRSPAGKED